MRLLNFLIVFPLIATHLAATATNPTRKKTKARTFEIAANYSNLPIEIRHLVFSYMLWSDKDPKGSLKDLFSFGTTNQINYQQVIDFLKSNSGKILFIKRLLDSYLDEEVSVKILKKIFKIMSAKSGIFVDWDTQAFQDLLHEEFLPRVNKYIQEPSQIEESIDLCFQLPRGFKSHIDQFAYLAWKLPLSTLAKKRVYELLEKAMLPAWHFGGDESKRLKDFLFRCVKDNSVYSHNLFQFFKEFEGVELNKIRFKEFPLFTDALNLKNYKILKFLFQVYEGDVVCSKKDAKFAISSIKYNLKYCKKSGSKLENKHKTLLKTIKKALKKK